MAVEPPEIAREISMECFKNKLIMELAGARNNVIKFLAPLIIPDDVLIEGLDILEAAIGAVLKNR